MVNVGAIPCLLLLVYSTAVCGGDAGIDERHTLGAPSNGLPRRGDHTRSSGSSKGTDLKPMIQNRLLSRATRIPQPYFQGTRIPPPRAGATDIPPPEYRSAGTPQMASVSTSAAAESDSIISWTSASVSEALGALTYQRRLGVDNFQQVSRDIEQPGSSPSSDDGSLLITPSQIAAIVIGTIVGTAMITLILVYFVSVCRSQRFKKSAERRLYKDSGRGGSPSSRYDDDDEIALDSLADDRTGRADAFIPRPLTREEKQLINWPSDIRPIVPLKHVGPKKSVKAQPISHRPSLPPLPEESPRVSERSGEFGAEPLGLGYNATGFANASNSVPLDLSMAANMPEQPEPVRLQLARRQSLGGSTKVQVVRVTSNRRNNSDLDGDDDDIMDIATSITGRTFHTNNPYFDDAEPGTSEPSTHYSTTTGAIKAESAGVRPSLVRTPSSDTLPHQRERGNQNGGSGWESLSGSAANSAPATANSKTSWVPVRPPLPAYPNPHHLNPRRIPDRSQNHIAFLLAQPSSPSLRPHMLAGSVGRLNTGINYGDSRHVSSILSIGPVTPASPSFHARGLGSYSPLASPSYISPLSPPPRSPLRAVRQSRSDVELRTSASSAGSGVGGAGLSSAYHHHAHSVPEAIPSGGAGGTNNRDEDGDGGDVVVMTVGGSVVDTGMGVVPHLLRSRSNSDVLDLARSSVSRYGSVHLPIMTTTYGGGRDSGPEVAIGGDGGSSVSGPRFTFLNSESSSLRSAAAAAQSRSGSPELSWDLLGATAPPPPPPQHVVVHRRSSSAGAITAAAGMLATPLIARGSSPDSVGRPNNFRIDIGYAPSPSPEAGDPDPEAVSPLSTAPSSRVSTMTGRTLPVTAAGRELLQGMNRAGFTERGNGGGGGMPRWSMFPNPR